MRRGRTRPHGAGPSPSGGWNAQLWRMRAAVVALALLAAGCDAHALRAWRVENGSDARLHGAAEGARIRLATDTAEVVVELNGTRAAAELVERLPLELRIIERGGIAKSVKMDMPLFGEETPTREYAIGDFGYWHAGPDLAIFYDHLYDETLVDEIPLGRALGDASVFADAEGMMRIGLVEEGEAGSQEP